MYTTPLLTLEDVRATLILRGTSFSAFCTQHGFTRQAVVAALKGTRKGPRSKALACTFLAKVRETE